MSDIKVTALVDGYDEEYRLSGECGVRAIIGNGEGKGAMLSTCTLEEDHSGVHEWDPEYVYEEDEDE